VFKHELEPLSESNWQTLQQNVATKDPTQAKDVSPTGASGPTSKPASFEDLAQSIGSEVIVDPYREIRGKFYAGKVNPNPSSLCVDGC
jgi:myo-inositol catabolism protein IolC